MSTLPQPASGEPTPLPAPIRTNTVVMGRQDFFSVLLRLIGIELYKIRRRAMSKVLSIIGIVIMILVFCVVSLGEIFVINAPATSFLPPQCSAIRNPQNPQGPTGQNCLDHPPTQAELALAEQNRQDALRNTSAPLRLPTSLFVAVQVTQFLGLVLLVILAGTIVGGEYSVGTVRLMFTRGPTRVQFLLSKLGAILICLVIGFILVLLIGLATGALLNLLSGVTSSLDFLNNGGLGHVLLYPFLAMFGLLVYTMLALFLSTVGRATAAGVAGTFVWWVLESVLSGVINLIAVLNRGPVGDFLKAVPDYFIGNNITALLQNQNPYITGGAPSQLSDLHAWLVLLVYLALFIGLSLWISVRRDITN